MKHAYLIMAHNQFGLLCHLLRSLDDERNDIFIHIDIKAGKFQEKKFNDACTKSNIYFLDNRIDVKWGHISIVECTFSLLEYAVEISKSKNIKYHYYHLLSGVDFPLKNQNDIHEFFDNKDVEFVHFAPPNLRENVLERYKCYWFMLSMRKKEALYAKLINKFINVSIKVQKIICNRGSERKIMYGSAWFSITDNCAKYVLDNKKWVFKRYRHTLLPDESFLQTLIYDSPFINRLYMDYSKQINDDHIACMRKIDWKRGGPYVWQERDFYELMSSGCMFARKFYESGESNRIVVKIESYINN